MTLQEKERVAFDDIVSTVSSRLRVCVVHPEAPASRWWEQSKNTMAAENK
jgi:hypothetical protein